MKEKVEEKVKETETAGEGRVKREMRSGGDGRTRGETLACKLAPRRSQNGRAERSVCSFFGLLLFLDYSETCVLPVLDGSVRLSI